jgi:hypothetical protein
MSEERWPRRKDVHGETGRRIARPIQSLRFMILEGKNKNEKNVKKNMKKSAMVFP